MSLYEELARAALERAATIDPIQVRIDPNGWLSYYTWSPTPGQEIFYYGASIGVWRGVYRFVPGLDDPVFSPHQMTPRDSVADFTGLLARCGLDSMRFVVDRLDAPWWMPDNGQDRPEPPIAEYPYDYPWDIIRHRGIDR